MTAPSENAQVVLLTGPGRAAVATVLVAGASAVDVVAGLFHPAGARPLADRPCGEIVYGRWQDRQCGEEVVVCRRAAECVEIHCHGGAAAPQAVVRALVERGCRELAWQDWVRRAASDPIVAAARVALAAAPTERTARILLDQHAGALARAIRAIAADVTAGQTDRAAQAIDELLRWAPLGRHLTEPWRVVLAGRPNVGKSSLINALVGFERSIVDAAAGTTRDVVTERTAAAGWPIELADTAGLRLDAGPIEAAGMALARERLTGADLIVLVFDASQDFTPQDRGLCDALPRALRVASKADLPGATVACPAELATSARTGQGIEALLRAIADRLVEHAPPPQGAVPFAEWQVSALAGARTALARRQQAAALAALAELAAFEIS